MSWRRRPWLRYLTLLVLAWLATASVAATSVVRTRDSADHAQETEFTVRTRSAAAYLGAHIANLHAQQRAWAAAVLSARTVGSSDLGTACTTVGFVACGVFSGDGTLITNSPHLTALVGRNFRYLEQVRRALSTGLPSVTGVTISPALGVPVVALGVPFETPSGRRVFTGVFRTQGADLRENLRHAMAMPATDFYVVDRAGALAASTRALPASSVATLAAVAPTLAARAAGRSQGEDGDRYFVAADVPGTPWRFVATVPYSVLYRSVQPVVAFAVAVLVGAGLLGLAAVVALSWTLRRRAEMAAELQAVNATLEQKVAERTSELDAAVRRLRASNAQRQRYAREVNDTIVQSLVAAEISADLGDEKGSRQLLHEASVKARRWIGEQLRDSGGYQPGALRRSRQDDAVPGEGRPDEPVGSSSSEPAPDEPVGSLSAEPAPDEAVR